MRNMESVVLKKIESVHNTAYSWRNLDRTPLRSMKKAAVLVPLVLCHNVVYVWLTRRSSKVTHGRGDVSFPGGMKDTEDRDEVDTCLREADEEIGLKKHQVQIIGHQIPRVNRRRILFTPVFGLVPPEFVPTPNEEVDLVFKLPLERFLSRQGHTFVPYTIRGLEGLVHFFNDVVCDTEVRTWGLTAQICLEVAILIFGRAPSFPYETKDVKHSISNPFSYQENYVKDYCLIIDGEQSSKSDSVIVEATGTNSKL